LGFDRGGMGRLTNGPVAHVDYQQAVITTEKVTLFVVSERRPEFASMIKTGQFQSDSGAFCGDARGRFPESLEILDDHAPAPGPGARFSLAPSSCHGA
jgi:hypothetical protein